MIYNNQNMQVDYKFSECSIFMIELNIRTLMQQTTAKAVTVAIS